MAGFPEDLIGEILLRLPVEALLRFRCVSKRWRNLIDSPNFVNSQLNLPNKPQFMMVLVFTEKLRIFYAELDSDCIENPSPNFKQLTLPRPSNVSNLVGHCNGLLCCVGKIGSIFIVLNPFTGKHIQVQAPEPQQLGSSYDKMSYWGFGYDKDSDDYKVVALHYSEEWIYSLKSGSWKMMDEFPYLLKRADGVFVNGALHWIGYYSDSSQFIFALHLGNLGYFSVPHPSEYSKKKLSHLGVLDGCLYAIYSDSPSCHDDLWVMKEYGVKESWTRLGTYSDLYLPRDGHFFSYSNSLVQCRFGSLWRKLNSSVPMGKLLVFEPSLVCPRKGV